MDQQKENSKDWFSRVPIEICSDRSATVSSMRTLVAICASLSKEPEAFDLYVSEITQKTIASRLGYSLSRERDVRRLIAELSGAGYLQVAPVRRDPGSRKFLVGRYGVRVDGGFCAVPPWLARGVAADRRAFRVALALGAGCTHNADGRLSRPIHRDDLAGEIAKVTKIPTGQTRDLIRELHRRGVIEFNELAVTGRGRGRRAFTSSDLAVLVFPKAAPKGMTEPLDSALRRPRKARTTPSGFCDTSPPLESATRPPLVAEPSKGKAERRTSQKCEVSQSDILPDRAPPHFDDLRTDVWEKKGWVAP